MAALIQRLFKNKKAKRHINTTWAEPKEKKEFQRTLESWKELPPEMMMQ